MKPHRQTFPTIFTTILLELRIYGNSIARHWFDSKWQEGRGTSTRVAQLSANSPLQFQILWPRKLVARFHVFLFKWLQHYYSGWNLVRKQPHLLTIVSIYREQRFTSVSYIFSDNFRHANNFLIVFTFLAVPLVVLFERSKFVRSSGFNCRSYRSVHCYSSFFFFFYYFYLSSRLEKSLMYRMLQNVLATNENILIPYFCCNSSFTYSDHRYGRGNSMQIVLHRYRVTPVFSIIL